MLVVAVVTLTAPDSDKQTATGGSSSASAPPSTTPTVSPSRSASPSSSATSKAQPGPSLSLGDSSADENAKKLPLIVLNNTRTTGLATDAADEFRDGGWKVDRVGNLTDDIISSCAYYDPDADGAEAAAKALRKQFPGIRRTVEKFSGLPDGPIVVVLTSGYSSN